MAISARNWRNSSGERFAAYFCRWNTASFCAFDHMLSPPTYARTEDKSPKLKLASINRQRTMAANIQMIANGELAADAASGEGAGPVGCVNSFKGSPWFVTLRRIGTAPCMSESREEMRANGIQSGRIAL